jgi:hypothetical protein
VQIMSRILTKKSALCSYINQFVCSNSWRFDKFHAVERDERLVDRYHLEIMIPTNPVQNWSAGLNATVIQCFRLSNNTPQLNHFGPWRKVPRDGKPEP